MTDNANEPNGAADNNAPNNDQIRDAQAVLRKNQELLGDLKATKEKLAAFEAAQQKADEEAARKAGDFEKLEGNLKAEILKEREATKIATSRFENLVKETALMQALIENKVSASFMDAAKAMFLVKGIEVDSDGNAKLGTVSISDAVKEWANSDAGKVFISAPDSAGGGASGSDANGKTTGNLGGTQQERVAAIKARFGNKLNT